MSRKTIKSPVNCFLQIKKKENILYVTCIYTGFYNKVIRNKIETLINELEYQNGFRARP